MNRPEPAAAFVMETTLHRQLKALHAGKGGQEVVVNGYRIDAIRGRRLIEVQCASLSAIRDKVRTLLATHDVLVVKPLAARKLLVTRESKTGPVIGQRLSPLKQTPFHLFEELVHFMTVFPHPRLTLQVTLAEWEEHRTPARRRRFRPQFRVTDRVLTLVQRSIRLKSAADLGALLPVELEDEFTTAELAACAKVPRWLAQKAAYCFRQAGVVEICGKRRNSMLYRRIPNHRTRRQSRAKVAS